jgi:hypothetical protein
MSTNGLTAVLFSADSLLSRLSLEFLRGSSRLITVLSPFFEKLKMPPAMAEAAKPPPE